MSRLFNRSTSWIVNRPWVTTLLLVLISGVAILGHVAPEKLTSLFEFENLEEEYEDPGPAETFVSPPNVNPFSVSRSDAILVVESDKFFTSRGAEAMRYIVEELEQLDQVKSVLWMDRVPILNIFGLPEPLFPQSSASEARFLAARTRALEHPLVVGQLLSSDGDTLLLLVNFEWLFVESDRDCTDGLREAAEQAAAKFPDVPLSFRVTGRVPIHISAVQTHEENRLRYQIIGYSMIALMAVILFRGISAVLIVAIAPSLGVFWTLGILQFFDFQNNPFNDVVLPVLLSLVGLTDGVHLMVQIRRFRVAGSSPRQAACRGIEEVGLACMLTSVTTAIGFGSLTLAHHEIVREFGICCVIGVILTFVAVVTSIPLACSTWLGKRVHVGHDRGLIDRHLDRIGVLIEFVLRRPKAMSIIGIATTGLFALVSLSLRPDERNANAMPTGSEAAAGLAQMDRALGGLEVGTVNVSWSNKIASDSTEVLEAITEVDDLLRSEQLLGHPLSIRNLIDALPGEGKAADRISLMELLPPPLKRAFYTPEYRQASLVFRVQDLGIARYGPVFERVQSGLDQIVEGHPEFQFELSGSAVWRWENLYQIVVDLAASLGSASLIIFVVLAIVYRSIRIGLISIVPNVFPLAVTGSFLVITGQALELVSVCAFTVCLGIAVDDTIHFLTRFQEEQPRTENQLEAIRRAFVGVGTALIMTTVILIAGFSTVLFSNSHDHRTFATMGSLTIGSALFADLVFLPALLARFVKRSPQSVED